MNEIDPKQFYRYYGEPGPGKWLKVTNVMTIGDLEKTCKQLEVEFGAGAGEIEQKLNQALAAMQDPKITFVTNPGEPGAKVYEVSLSELEREQHRRALAEDGAEFWEDAQGKTYWRKDNGEWQLLD